MRKNLRKAPSASALALLAAALYALSVPLSKLLLRAVTPGMLAALLYLGAGFGMLLCRLVRRAVGTAARAGRLTRAELPWAAAMVALDIAASLLLLFGVAGTTAANASLLSNFEIAATALVALLAFGERIPPRLWGAIALVSAASGLLGFDGGASLAFGRGSLLVLAAACCWGTENNCTRQLSAKDPAQVVTIKGCFSGAGALVIALLMGEKLPPLPFAAAALAVGFVSYGLSVGCYLLAQRQLGAARTSAWYAAAPFLSVGFSLLFLGERPAPLFWPALALMAAAALLLHGKKRAEDENRP